MKTLIQLDKHDIEQIIAEHFGVDSAKVIVEPYIATVGYGMAETQMAFVRAEVENDSEITYFKKPNRYDYEHPADNYGCYT